MTDDKRSMQPAHHPEHEAAAPHEAGPPPEDLRDTYGSGELAIGDAAPIGNIDVPEAPTGPYPPTSVVERPHASEPTPSVYHEPTRDPSLSRAVDRAAAGLEPDAAGYDRTIEGPPPGPLDADADRDSPDSEDQPGGQWGSSG